MTPAAARIPLIALSLCLLAACGSSSAKSGGSQTGSATVSSSPTPRAQAGTVTSHVGKSFWAEGFKVDVGDAVYHPPVLATPPGGSSYEVKRAELTIDADFENLGADTSRMYGEMNVTSGNNAYTNQSAANDIPNVPGKEKSHGVIAFLVDTKFDLKTALLTVESAEFNQAKIPLGSSGKYVSNQPQSLAVSGNLTAGHVVINITSADIRADLPGNHREVAAGKMALTVNFSVTNTSDNTCCLGESNFALKLPDGTAIAPSASACCGLPANGTTETDKSVQFIVKVPVDGAYSLILKGDFAPGNKQVQSEFPFNVGNGGGGGGGGGASPAPTDSTAPTDSASPGH